MLDDLAREFPEVGRAAAWTRGRLRGKTLGVRREPVLWATVSAIGAGFLVAEIVQFLIGVTSWSVELLRASSPNVTLFPLTAIAGTAAAAAVALRAGGAPALALDIGYVVLGIALRIPDSVHFCERPRNLLDADLCTPVGFLGAQWPQGLGIVLGIILARAVTARGGGQNDLLRVAGTFALALFVVTQAWAATMSRAATATNATNSGLVIAALMACAAAVAGVVAGQMARPLRTATVVAAIYLLPWLVLQLPLVVRDAGLGAPPEYSAAALIAVLAPPIAAGTLVLAASLASRSRFVPRGPA